MSILDLFIGASITVLSLGLFVLSMLGYYRRRNPKMIFVSLVFLIFFIKGIMLSLGIFSSEIIILNTSINPWIFDLLILVLLYITSLKG